MDGIHKGSYETYKFIADYIDKDFFFSRNDKWDRMGFLGVFGDYILSCTQGAILEIGVGESSVYLTALARKYKRKIYNCDISASKIVNPMTVQGYLHEDHVFVKENEVPDREAQALFYAGPSDKFFRDIKIEPIALGFIDGDHIYEQAKKDFFNLVPLMVDHGYIILHDTYPPNESYLTENTCGGVYKLRQEIEELADFDVLTLTRGTAMGVGMTLVRNKPMHREYYND